jgi:hypothetical protein
MRAPRACFLIYAEYIEKRDGGTRRFARSDGDEHKMNLMSHCSVRKMVCGLLAATKRASRAAPARRAERRPTIETRRDRGPPDRRGAYRSVVNTLKRYRISPEDDSPDARFRAFLPICGALPRR